ncbi:MAG: hypothetical protein KAW16_00195 [candidate division Zixibacteria bacterium]|nr:hypothetical protein [candidate division Zixibacteria bacterium]
METTLSQIEALLTRYANNTILIARDRIKQKRLNIKPAFMKRFALPETLLNGIYREKEGKGKGNFYLSPYAYASSILPLSIVWRGVHPERFTLKGTGVRFMPNILPIKRKF